ncbi:MAG: EthD family reductase [Bacteroidota bacterium]
MISLTVLYPKTADSQFNMDYYLNTHIPLAKERLSSFGLKGVDLLTGLAGGAPDSPPLYAMIGTLHFDSMESFQNAMATHGAELTGDIPNYTNVEPIMQICQPA